MAVCTAAASLSLSPGRQSSRPIVKSPATGYRSLGGSLTTVVRTTKSMSDLIQPPQGTLCGRQEPTRILVNSGAGSLRGGSPPPRASPRMTIAGQLPETSCNAATAASPGLVVQSSTLGPITPRQSNRSLGMSVGQQLPSRRTSVTSRTSAAGPVIWPGAVRCSSADRSPQWASTPTAASGQSGPSSMTALSARARISPGRASICPGSGASAVLPVRLTSMSPPKLHSSSSALAPVGPVMQGVQVALAPARRAASMVVPAYSITSDSRQDQVTKLRNTLMQQIHTVQQELQRVELERQSLQPRARSPQRSNAVASNLRDARRCSQPSAGCPERSGKAVSAAVRIQKFWRRRASRHNGAPSSSRCSKSAAKPVRFPHHAAIRIQRAWKLNRWRRLFVAYCRRDLGWVGSLEWLQRHNMLYGTELAEQEDLDWWNQQQPVAPLDYDVDPWGCKKLRDHLNKMWYGYLPEDVQQQSANLQKTVPKGESAGSRHSEPNAANQAGKTPKDTANGVVARDVSAPLDGRRQAALSTVQQAGASRSLLQSQLPRDMPRQTIGPVSASSSMQPVVSARMGACSLAIPATLPQGTVNRSTLAASFSPRLEARQALSASTLALHRSQSPIAVHQGPRGSAMAPRFQTLPGHVHRGSLQCYVPDRTPGLLVN